MDMQQYYKRAGCKRAYVQNLYNFGIRNRLLLSDVELHNLDKDFTSRIVAQANDFCKNCKY